MSLGIVYKLCAYTNGVLQLPGMLITSAPSYSVAEIPSSVGFAHACPSCTGQSDEQLYIDAFNDDFNDVITEYHLPIVVSMNRLRGEPHSWWIRP